MSPEPSTYRELGERAWAWVLTQVCQDAEGVWLPEHPAQTVAGKSGHGMHSGAGGLAHTMAEIRLSRRLTAAELDLGTRIGDTLVRRLPQEVQHDYFDGVVSTIGVLIALRAPGVDRAVARLLELAGPDGWPVTWAEPPRWAADARCNDATLGTAGVLLGAVWAHRHGVPRAAELADRTAEILLAEREQRADGVYWPFVPLRCLRAWDDVQMPNWSHGQAGIAAAMVVAGIVLDRSDLVDVATSGAEYLLSLGDTSDGGLRLPHRIPGLPDLDTFTYSWCHGPTGTSLLFAALERAGVPAVGGSRPTDHELACLRSLLGSGIPARLYPGFWDNDGRCCGTAGVGDVVLGMWQRHGRDEELAFAVTLGDALVERAVHHGDHAFWRFVEHRSPDPLLPPGPGWMQGAAGIAAYLFRLARVLEDGPDASVPARMDNWWACPW